MMLAMGLSKMESIKRFLSTERATHLYADGLYKIFPKVQLSDRSRPYKMAMITTNECGRIVLAVVATTEKESKDETILNQMDKF